MNTRLEQALEAAEPETRRIFTVRFDAQESLGGPLAGVDISVKDNIDTAGVTTTAGSAAFESLPPAAEDAIVVKRLRSAGACVFAKTNMTEFAYSTHGLNRRFGTPRNPRSSADAPRVAGGSSSGAGVAVARKIGIASIGTDTAGSVRIPAALCGTVGFKPHQERIPRAGVVPLSSSYDCVGVLADCVRTAASVFHAIADPWMSDASSSGEVGRPYRILIPAELDPVLDSEASEETRRSFSSALDRLSQHGRFEFVRDSATCYRGVLELTPDGGIVGPEAYAFHKPFLERFGALYEPFTLRRLALGERCSAQRYAALLARRRELIAESRVQLREFDAVMHLTCPMVAPLLADFTSIEATMDISMQLLRYTLAANALDLASISIPCSSALAASRLPVGLCLETTAADEELLHIAAAAERALSG